MATLAHVLLILLVIGIVGGLLTYTIPLTPHREREIRQCSAELLGLSVDPARVKSEMSLAMVDYAGKHCGSENNPRTKLIYQLIATRANIAQAINVREMESKTDELLARIRHG